MADEQVLPPIEEFDELLARSKNEHLSKMIVGSEVRYVISLYRAALTRIAEQDEEITERRQHDEYNFRLSSTSLEVMDMTPDEMKADDIKEWLELSETCTCVHCKQGAFILRLLARAETAEALVADLRAQIAKAREDGIREAAAVASKEASLSEKSWPCDVRTAVLALLTPENGG